MNPAGCRGFYIPNQPYPRILLRILSHNLLAPVGRAVIDRMLTPIYFCTILPKKNAQPPRLTRTTANTATQRLRRAGEAEAKKRAGLFGNLQP